jgi:hypothetical protein
MWEHMRKQADAVSFNKVDFLLMIKRARQLIWKSCFTTGASEGPTGINTPICSCIVKACPDPCAISNFVPFSLTVWAEFCCKYSSNQPVLFYIFDWACNASFTIQLLDITSVSKNILCRRKNLHTKTVMSYESTKVLHLATSWKLFVLQKWI